MSFVYLARLRLLYLSLVLVPILRVQKHAVGSMMANWLPCPRLGGSDTPRARGCDDVTYSDGAASGGCREQSPHDGDGKGVLDLPGSCLYVAVTTEGQRSVQYHNLMGKISHTKNHAADAKGFCGHAFSFPQLISNVYSQTGPTYINQRSRVCIQCHEGTTNDKLQRACSQLTMYRLNPRGSYWCPPLISVSATGSHTTFVAFVHYGLTRPLAPLFIWYPLPGRAREPAPLPFPLSLPSYVAKGWRKEPKVHPPP